MPACEENSILKLLKPTICKRIINGYLLRNALPLHKSSKVLKWQHSKFKLIRVYHYYYLKIIVVVAVTRI